ncbi:MAG: hypothetical protein NT164_07850 [Verrucomicrobiae bacterium]|nr:hypothetical protein [Verrucomicrobiae bacterium]
MKSSFLAFPLFLLIFLGITSLVLRAESGSEQTVTRENYRECLQSVASQEDSCGLYDANIAAEGIVQTPTTNGSLHYIIADGVDLEAPIHGLTKLQQEDYCDWFQDQKKNQGTCCYLKNEVEKNALPDNQETVIVISSSDKALSPLMMFEESEKKKAGANRAQQERIAGDRTSEPTDLSSLQQRDTQAAKIQEADDTSVMSDPTYSDDASTRVSSYHQSPTQLEKQITSAREKAFAATQELLALQSHQHEIQALWDSYRNIQKTLASAYTLRRCLKKSSTDQLQAYQQIVHGICREAELSYHDAQQKLRTFSQLPGCTRAANTFIEQAYANFSETQKKLYDLKQQHEQGLSADADSVSSTLAQADENSKRPSEITAPSPSKISKPTTEEQEALRLEQFLKEHQWYGVGKGGEKIALSASLSQEENDVELSLEEEAPQKLLSSTSPPALPQRASSPDETTAAIDHALLEREQQLHEEASQRISAGEPAAISVAALNKKSKKKKLVAEAPTTKSDADWETEIREKFPQHSFKLEEYDYDQFQENAARLLNLLIDNPAHSSLFVGISRAACDDIKNLTQADYVISGDEKKPLRALKEFTKKRVDEEYYPTYIQEKIRLAKSHAAELERLSKRAAEAEKKLLAELEAETKTRQPASETKKSKSKKK